MSSLRLLTWNTQLRSWLMEMGFPPALPPTYTAPERAKEIARRLAEPALELDVVCLNEVFDEDARDILSEGLEARFPFQVSKADTFHYRVVQPGVGDDIMEKVWALTFGPLSDLGSLAMLKFEDSGLFFASALPFATVPVPPEVQLLLSPPVAAAMFPTGVPIVRFQMYADASGNDARAAKGVLYVRLRHNGANLHVFASHTQADDESAEENASVREGQMKTVAAFVTACVGQAPPFTEEVYFVGDLNIIGRPAQDATPTQEWALRFTGSAPVAQGLIDHWGSDQCPGGNSGRTDPGWTADVVYPPLRQRLDYVFGSRSSTQLVQHLRIAHALGDPQGALPYLSDHLPLLADINRVTPHGSPARAEGVPDVVDFTGAGELRDGSVQWFRYDQPGTYDFMLLRHGGRARMEIFLGDDFSTPQPPYRQQSNPDRGPRFVLMAPFFVKVSLVQRRSEARFELRSHRHQGREWRDAIVLVPGLEVVEHFPASPFNNDTNDADWDDAESKWFLVETPRVRVPGAIHLSVTVSQQVLLGPAGDERTKLDLTLGKWDGQNPPVSKIDQLPESPDPLTLAWDASDNQSFMVLVKRFSGIAQAVRFHIRADTSVCLLRALPAARTTLTCVEETSGWGDDDIALQVRADGALVADISNAVIGDFSDDAVRAVGDKLPAIVAYQNGIEVTVIEEDDIDANDIGRGTVPLVKDAATTPGFTVLGPSADGTVEGKLRITVDDGSYDFACRIGPWAPEA